MYLELYKKPSYKVKLVSSAFNYFVSVYIICAIIIQVKVK